MFEAIVIGGCVVASLSELAMREARASISPVTAEQPARRSAQPLGEGSAHAGATGLFLEWLS